MIQLTSKKLNLGCGRDKRDGYVNVDLNSYCSPDLQANVLDLRDFPSHYYEEILALGVIEHFKRIDTRTALYEWNRLLVTGGILDFSTTYLDGLVRKLDAPSLQSVKGHELIVETLFAGQTGEGDYHLTSYSELLLRYYLWECGFDIDKIGLRHGWLFEVQAHKARDYSFVELENEPDDHVFLTGAYREILGRAPDETGFRQFAQALAAKQLTRRDVVRTMLHSAERKETMIARAPRFPRVFDPRDSLLADPLLRGATFTSYVWCGPGQTCVWS